MNRWGEVSCRCSFRERYVSIFRGYRGDRGGFFLCSFWAGGFIYYFRGVFL